MGCSNECEAKTKGALLRKCCSFCDGSITAHVRSNAERAERVKVRAKKKPENMLFPGFLLVPFEDRLEVQRDILVI